MKVLVEALDTYKKNNIADEELKRAPETGEQFEVSKERLEVLLGNNPYKMAFVKIVEPAEPKKEKATLPKKNKVVRKK